MSDVRPHLIRQSALPQCAKSARAPPGRPVQSAWARPRRLRSEPPMIAVRYSYRCEEAHLR
jgi:hypothetical protein